MHRERVMLWSYSVPQSAAERGKSNVGAGPDKHVPRTISLATVLSNSLLP